MVNYNTDMNYNYFQLVLLTE